MSKPNTRTLPKHLERYSDAQRQAISAFGESVVLSAGAGSGKTTVLVERFMHAVEVHGASAERILAITFTEKAANEMKTRLVSLCQARGLETFRRQIENAWIGTIDGFCARLLKENPIEAGVDPFFRILGEGESEILMNRVADDLLKNESENEEWLAVLTDFGEEEIRAFFKRVSVLSRSDMDTARFFETALFSPDESLVREKLKALCEYGLKETSAGSLNATEKGIREGSGTLLQILQRTPAFTDWQTYHVFEESLGLFAKRGRLQETAHEAKELGQAFLRYRLQEMGLPKKKCLLDVCSRFMQRYREEKKRLAVYDFSDLLYETYRLMSSETPGAKALQSYYREYFQHLFVDEFQDSNPLQAKLFARLQNGKNLFVVGDPKQSIYSFRGAEPKVFADITKTSRPLDLSDNFRSTPDVIALVNALFEKIFPQDFFTPLVALSQFSQVSDQPFEILCAVKDKTDSEGSETQEEARVEEARLLAERIQSLVNSQTPIHADGLIRPLQYGDIAVLFRSMTASHYYEKELIDLGIPYRLVKGKGFYDKPEIKDLLHYLKILDNPSLDISLACVLRSPLFGVSDEGLYWLARYAKRADKQTPLFSGISAVSNHAEMSQADREKIRSFASFYEETERLKDRVPIADILDELIRRCCLEVKLLCGAEGKQKTANVRKFVEVAREVEAGGVPGIADFVHYVEGLKDRETVEAEAKIEPEKSNAVILSSIHAAKGLEFACVAIADMGRARSGKRHGRLTLSGAFGLGSLVKNPVTLKREKDHSFYETETEENRREKEEADRLFYVAMTRARERIIFSGSISWDPKKSIFKDDGSWMARLLNLLKVQSPSPQEVVFSSQTLVFRTGREEGLGDLQKQPVVTVREVRRQMEETILSESAGDIVERFNPTLKPYFFLRDATVTELLSVEAKESEPYRPQLGFSDEENIPRNEFGTLFHRAMELSLTRVRAKKAFSSNYLDPLLQGLSVDEKEEISRSVFSFWKGPQGEAVKRASACYPELPFIYKTPYGLLKGQMDLVYRDQAGQWVVLDYKTNQVLPEGKEPLAKHYEFQLELYALVFRDLYGEAPERGVLYFSTLDDTTQFSYDKQSYERTRKRLFEVFGAMGNA